ncbi:MAG: L,D-transpeptidase family protein [Clostridiales bacterium]|nr:L,D-transpeptidase family protein [Clostridiales bacterium]
MKRRLAAILLSLTLCVTTVVGTSAESFSSGETESEAVSADVGEVQDLGSEETEAEVTAVPTEAPAENLEESSGDASDTGTSGTSSGTTSSGDTFTSGEGETLTEETGTETEDELLTDAASETVSEDVSAEETESASTGAVTDSTGLVIASESDWVSENGKFKLKKASTDTGQTESGNASGEAAESSGTSEEEGTTETVEALLSNAQEELTAETVQTTEKLAEDSGEIQNGTVSGDAAASASGSEGTETVETDSSVQAGTETETGDVTVDSASATEQEYFTAEDGILQIQTGTHTGYYMFDESGYMVTGRINVEAGTSGHPYSTTEELYFMESDLATLYTDTTETAITPWSSDLGQQQKGYWLWTGTTFRYYTKTGRYNLGTTGILKKIGDDWYCLDSNGKPYTGYKNLTTSSGTTAKYYFQPASSSSDIPGKMFYDGWISRTTDSGTQWMYFIKSGSQIGQMKTHTGYYVSQLNGDGTTKYLLSKSGYITKSAMKKAENGSYYGSNSKGVIYKSKLVTYNGARYYFTANGKRSTCTNGWYTCPGASNRKYYFGSTPGKIVEKSGWQKVVTSSGSFYGWYYFSSTTHNCFINRWVNDYYFDSVGRLASGLRKVDGSYYFFRISTSSSRKGKVYKSSFISYNGSWYYAQSSGVLYRSGWHRIGNYWYYFKGYKVVTDTYITHSGINGYLDSQGRFTNGWIVVSDSENLVRYVDPYGSGYLKSTSQWIDGQLFYFDSNGYRINDISNIYTGSYYVEVDRVNCVMTVYTSSAKTIPVKSIRVSVGTSSTPTPTGTYYLQRSDRWKLLMGPSYGQYASHVVGAGQGGIYVHSVAGSAANSYSLPAAEYNKLGNPASHGCIRVCVADALWVYNNCNGATIRIFDGTYNSSEVFKGPLGRPALTPLVYPYNYDPTDPAV